MGRVHRKTDQKIPEYLRGRRPRPERGRTRVPSEHRVPDEETFETIFTGNAEAVDLYLEQYAPRT